MQEGKKECILPWLFGSRAVVMSDYVLGIGCSCDAPLVPWPLLSRSQSGIRVACRDMRLTHYPRIGMIAVGVVVLAVLVSRWAHFVARLVHVASRAAQRIAFPGTIHVGSADKVRRWRPCMCVLAGGGEELAGLCQCRACLLHHAL